MTLEGQRGFCVPTTKSTFGKLIKRLYFLIHGIIPFSMFVPYISFYIFQRAYSMTMGIVNGRGREESFLIPINNFMECKRLCTYWNKVGKHKDLVEFIKP